MEKLPLSGLRFRTAAALAAVLILFIVLTEITVSRLTRMAVFHGREAAATAEGDDAAPGEDTALAESLRKLRKPVLFYLIVGAVLALAAATFATSRLVVRPLGRLNDALERVASGNLDTVLPLGGGREISEISRAFNHMTGELKTQKIELEDRLRRIEAGAAALAAAQENLIRSAKLASVGTLAAGVAHEIGNPLTGLLGLVQNLEAGVDKETEAKFLDLMKRELNRIDTTIRELLSYARAPADSEAESAAEADLFAAVDRVRTLLGAQRLFDRIQWKIPAPAAPAIAAISSDDLTQLLLNLFLNAAQAMDGDGTIEMAVTPLDNWKRSERSPGIPALRIAVSDTGPGIPAADAERIFDPFFSARRHRSGTGLGLSICRNLCYRTGGDLRLDADATDGARFLITLPIPAAG